eukprot:6408301-Amphidinium_carterae.1
MNLPPPQFRRFGPFGVCKGVEGEYGSSQRLESPVGMPTQRWAPPVRLRATTEFTIEFYRYQGQSQNLLIPG